MSKAKTEATFQNGGNVPPGTVMHLTYEQADARRHLLKPLKEWHRDARDETRRPFVGSAATYFKAGEQVVLEGEIDAGLSMSLGLGKDGKAVERLKNDEASGSAVEKARVKGIAAGRKQMLAEVEAYNAALDAADEAEDKAVAAETAAKDKPELKAAADAARAAAAKAADAAAALKPKA